MNQDAFVDIVQAVNEIICHGLNMKCISCCYVNSDKFEYDNLCQSFIFAHDFAGGFEHDPKILEISRKNPEHVCCVLLPQDIPSSTGLDWVATAAVLDMIPKRSLVLCLPYVDWSEVNVEPFLEKIENASIELIYMPAVSYYRNRATVVDVTEGNLIFTTLEERTEDSKNWQTNRRYDRKPDAEINTKRIRFLGEIPEGFVYNYIDDVINLLECSYITSMLENLISTGMTYSARKDNPPFYDFVKAVSLGTLEIRKDVEDYQRKFSAMPRLEALLDKSNIWALAKYRANEKSQNVVDHVKGYMDLWNTTSEPYGMTFSRKSMRMDNFAQISEMAKFLGVDSMIEAYAAGISVEDILV